MSESLSTPRDHPLAPHLAYTLARKLIDGQLVLFAGAGLSHLAPATNGSDRHLPLWAGLTDAVARRFGFEPADFSGSPLDLFDAVIHEHSRGELEQAVTAVLDDRDFELSATHRALAELPWRKVVTTNYDALLARLLNESYPISNESGYDRFRESRVIQIHGCLPQPHTLTRDDYRLWPDKNPRAAQALRDFVLSHTLLFVGYSLSDPHIDELLALVRSWTKDREKRLYGLFWQIPKAKQDLLDRRDKITAVSIDTPEEWQNAFRQIKAEFDRLSAAGGAAPVEVRDDPFAYDRAQYLQAVQAKYGIANLQGLYIWGAGYARDDVKLGEIFVEPDLCEWQTVRSTRGRGEDLLDANMDPSEASEYRHERERQERLRELAPRRETASTLLARESRLCIVGAPGQGKSTLLRQHLLKSVAVWRDVPEQPFPVYLRLSEWEHHAAGAEGRFIGWAKQAILSLGEIGGPAAAAWLQGRVWWLLDGVDEIRDPYQRQALQDELLTLLASRPQDRAVLATRPQGYPLGGFGSAWRDAELPPLNPAQSRQVLANWGAVLRRKEANLFFDALTVDRELERQPGLRQVRGNALLLTLVVLFYKNNRRLPHDRWEYFDKAENALRDSWLAYRLPEASRNLPGDYLPVFLERLALFGMKQGMVSFPAEVLKRVARELLRERGYTGREIDEEIKRLLRAADDLIGVIAAQAPERYGFLHLAFQEFLAARALVNRSDWCAGVIADYWDEPDWEEVWGYYAKGIKEDEVRLDNLLRIIQENRHPLDKYLYRPERVCLRLVGYSDAPLQLHWAPIMKWIKTSFGKKRLLTEWIGAILLNWERHFFDDLKNLLMRSINHRLEWVRHAALDGLASFASEPLICEALVAHIQNNKSTFYKRSVELLTPLILDEHILDIMLKKLGYNEHHIQGPVIAALHEMANYPQIRKSLIERIKINDNRIGEKIRSILTMSFIDHADVQELILENYNENKGIVNGDVVKILSMQPNQQAIKSTMTDIVNGTVPADYQAKRLAAKELAKFSNDQDVRKCLLQFVNKSTIDADNVVETLIPYIDEPNIRKTILNNLMDKREFIGRTILKAIEPLMEDYEFLSAVLRIATNENGFPGSHEAIRMLAPFAKQPQVTETLLNLLKSRSFNVREAAVDALGWLADNDNIRAALMKQLTEGDSGILSKIFKILEPFGFNPTHHGPLLKRFESQRGFEREEMVKAFGSYIDDFNIQKIFIKLLQEDNEFLSSRVIDALMPASSQPIVRQALLDYIEKKGAKWFYSELMIKFVHEPDFQRKLINRLGKSEYYSRVKILKLLSRYANEPNIQSVMINRMADKHYEVQKAAAEALTQAAIQDRRRQRQERALAATPALSPTISPPTN